MTAKIVWQPTDQQIQASNMKKFMTFVNDQHSLSLDNYQALYTWSLHQKENFWQCLWQFAAIKSSKLWENVLVPGKTMRETKWFSGAQFNFAENLLQKKNNELALIFNNEKNNRKVYSYAELYEAVAKVAAYFRKIGLKKNDRVAAILPNIPETIIAMLATTSIGAIWSSCSPDFGQEGLFDRLSQIQPKLLLSCDGYFYNGKVFNNSEKINYLIHNIPSVEKAILIHYAHLPHSIEADNFEQLLLENSTALEFEQLPFDHPVYILYSSGTTGVPKCIVHGAGGTLLQHLKELILHTNLTAKDLIFYFTTCGWMMWNWYISSLATGATVIQYDGAPFFPTPARLLHFIDEEKITVFGTSATYISTLEKRNLIPKNTHDLSSLRSILSTGSPLTPKNFDYVYDTIKKDVCLSSISGGTDILSCFALGNPILPVYRGELQCIGLGMDVHIFNEEGHAVIEEKGELVCQNAFPSMPIYFWNDPDGEKYQHAYFNKFPGMWAHGDFAEMTRRGTLIIYGRSDAVLNPGGVRIGTAEI
jgi:acetoacetyl-CoA synthetase